MRAYKTEQEAFWAGEFGREYVDRNKSDRIIASDTALFERILQSAPDIETILELGCNIGLNLRALHAIKSSLDLTAYEINERAVQLARDSTKADVRCDTIIESLSPGRQFDLTFTKGVLIHINPEQLTAAYENLYNLSRRYILVCEYYNPTPVEVNYRGHAGKLFKRDFAGEMIDKYELDLIDYGFVYHRDKRAPLDDVTWFLMRRP